MHVESSDTMRSRKAQCQTPPENPETGDTHHSRESRSCADEKIEHQHEYKRHSSSSAGTHICIQARLISTNPGCTEEARECGLPRETCFAARCLELVAVAGRLWISWCVLGGADFVRFFSFIFLRTHTAYCKYEATLPHVPLY